MGHWWKTRRGKRLAAFIQSCKAGLAGPRPDDAADTLQQALDYAAAIGEDERQRRALDAPIAAGLALLARYRLGAGDFPGALRLLERAGEFRGPDQDALELLAELVAEAERTGAAGAIFAETEAPRASSWLYCYARGLHEMRIRRLKAAEKSFQECEKRMGSDVALVELQRGHLAFLSGDAMEALARYRKARDLAPHDWRGHYWVGRAHLLLGEPREALAAFKESVDKGSAASGSFAAGVAAEALGDHEEATRLYDDAVHDPAFQARAALRSALCLAARGQAQDALGRLERLAQQTEHSDRARYLAGILLAREGRTAEALGKWRQLSDKTWTRRAARKALFLRWGQANKALAEGRFDTALRLWKALAPKLRGAAALSARANAAEAGFRKAAALAARGAPRDETAQALEAVLPDQPSPRAEHYAFVLGVARGRTPQFPGDSLFNDKRYGARARFHRAMLQARSGQLLESDIEELGSRDPRFRLPALATRLANHLAASQCEEAIHCLSRLLACHSDGAANAND